MRGSGTMTTTMLTTRLTSALASRSELQHFVYLDRCQEGSADTHLSDLFYHV